MSEGQRLAAAEVEPAAYQAVYAMEKYVRSSGLEPALLELVKIRASQINGCAFCLDMHHREARDLGESATRLDVLSAWAEVAGLYTDRERAALALTEAVTRISEGGVDDDLWAQVRLLFSDNEIVQLTMAIATINVWNRLSVTTRAQPASLVAPGA